MFTPSCSYIDIEVDGGSEVVSGAKQMEVRTPYLPYWETNCYNK